jgi:signal peptidase I
VNKMLYAPPGRLAGLLPYHEPERGDVVVFRFPLDPSDYVVKRIIGVPGDRIHLANGVVFRNGEPLHESYAIYEQSFRDAFRDQFPRGVYTDPGVDTRWWLEMRRDLQNGELVVPPGSYFVLGDNRNHSRDSRYWGFVPRGNIVGRPLLIYFSLREGSFSLRGGSPAGPASLPDDRLGGESDPVGGLVDFARWDRMFRIVR